MNDEVENLFYGTSHVTLVTGVLYLFDYWIFCVWKEDERAIFVLQLRSLTDKNTLLTVFLSAGKSQNSFFSSTGKAWKITVSLFYRNQIKVASKRVDSLQKVALFVGPTWKKSHLTESFPHMLTLYIALTFSFGLTCYSQSGCVVNKLIYRWPPCAPFTTITLWDLFSALHPWKKENKLNKINAV